MPLQGSLLLPALYYSPKRLHAGIIQWQLLPEIEVQIASIEPFNISKRRTEQAYTTELGEIFIITERPSCPCPSGITGVLQKAGDKLKWLSHMRLEEIKSLAFPDAWKDLSADATRSWYNAFNFRAEEIDETGQVIRAGLRPPQIGAVHAIAAHWSLHSSPGTIIMPTGTGKTETMLAALVSQIKGKLLVVVPSVQLKSQTARKFLTLGLLRTFGNVPSTAQNPIIGIISRRPAEDEGWKIIESCNVIVASISTIAQGDAVSWLGSLAEQCTHLFIDEAHHVAADSWQALRDAFNGKPVIQFTATPFRRDGKAVDGKVIYNYPLQRAQKDGYFKQINFLPVFEVDSDNAHKVIAKKAVEQLEVDLENNLNHVVMARCNTIDKAKQVYEIYNTLAAKYNPVLVHSDSRDIDALKKVLDGTSRIVVCVDMLGEGFDLPQLKIAALHDMHKSLAVLLQFIGRFTRTSRNDIGDATVIGNTANPSVPNALDRLYNEDADWNQLLSEYSSQAIAEHMALIEFLQNSKRLDRPDNEDEVTLLSPKMLMPKFSAVIYKATEFSPKSFHTASPAPFCEHAGI